MIRHAPDCADDSHFTTWEGQRGDTMTTCSSCKWVSRLAEPEPSPPSRYLLVCVRCGTTMHLDNPRPRVPLCDGCKSANGATRSPHRDDLVDGGAW